MSKSNLYHVISPITNESVYFTPHFAEAIAYAEKHMLITIHGDDGSIWKYEPHVITKEQRVVMCWSRVDSPPLSEKLTNWLDEQYSKYVKGIEQVKSLKVLPLKVFGCDVKFDENVPEDEVRVIPEESFADIWK